MNEKLTEVFVEEALELLDGLEGHLLILESEPHNTEAINAAFRALHSIKGSAAMFGYNAVGDIAHRVETLLDHFRTMKLPLSNECSDLVLQAGDYLRDLIQNPQGEHQTQGARIEALLEQVSQNLELPFETTGQKDVEKKEHTSTMGGYRTYRIRYAPDQGVYLRGVKPDHLVQEILALGNGSSYCHTDKIPHLGEFQPDTCYVYWDILLSTKQDENAIQDVFLFEEGSATIDIEELDPAVFIEEDHTRRLGEILAARSLDPADIKAALGRQRHLGEILVKDFNAPPQEVEEALFIQEHAQTMVQTTREEIERKIIRVHSEKLDGLLNLVGELVTVQAQLSQAVKKTEDRQVQTITDYIKRLIAELRSTSMDLRMVALDTLFSKYKRLVRDLSKTLSKPLNLVLEGSETEIDKSVIDALADPITHLVRNAADHGIERPEERLGMNKAEMGTITLAAIHAGSFVRISCRDDGGGINHERILARALEKGIVHHDAQLSKQEIEMLLFAPGFSTASSVSCVSGRGVGLDVVKTAIEQLGGTVSIQSERNRGTSFILDIPLTMAIIDGFLARAGRQRFIIPLASVHSCFERQRPIIKERMIVSAGELIPYASIRDFFAIEETPSEREELIIVNIFDARIALGFDQVLGGYQTVIKPLGELVRVMPGLSGSAILADGGIALILDIAALANEVKNS